MRSRDFCYWLQGFFEISSINDHGNALSPKQVECIRRHLDMVFYHEIDPSMGDQEHQDTLTEIHDSSFKLTPEQHKEIDEVVKKMTEETESSLPSGGFIPGCGPGCPAGTPIKC